MVLPLVPLVLIGTGAVSGVAGLFNGAHGAGKLKQAQGIADKTKSRYHAAAAQTQVAVDKTNAAVAAYGAEQEQARRQVVTRMAEFIHRNQRQVSESSSSLLEGVEAEIAQVAEFAGALGAGVDWVAGATKAGLTGAATYTAIPAAVGALGAASTGTAIGSLSGAAAESATMAWLGGGSLAVGGGGVALGATALNFVTFGPALLVGGLVLNGQGEKALTRARDYEAEVGVALVNQKSFRSLLVAVDTRVEELGRLLAEMVRRGSQAIGELEREPFDATAHAEQFQRAMRLTLAVRDLVGTPVVTDAGELNHETERLLFKYREKS